MLLHPPFFYDYPIELFTASFSAAMPSHDANSLVSAILSACVNRYSEMIVHRLLRSSKSVESEKSFAYFAMSLTASAALHITITGESSSAWIVLMIFCSVLSIIGLLICDTFKVFLYRLSVLLVMAAVFHGFTPSRPVPARLHTSSCPPGHATCSCLRSHSHSKQMPP